MISLQQVSKVFNGSKAVNNISIDIEEGENLVLLGTSGCGKTTTLRMINRLIETTSGRIIVNGKNIVEQSPQTLRKGIGYVLQHNGLFPHYTVAENIAIVPKLLNWDKQKTENRTVELLEKLHLDPNKYSNVYPAQLSGGQQQRVGLARALAADPPILLMDEPFGALDPVTRISIRKDFIKLEEFQKKTIVLVTHDVQEAFELGDRICLMNKGEIVQVGTPADLLFNPANEFVKSFLQEQRFTLELQAITLEAINNDLADADPDKDAISVTSKTSLWQLLQLLSDANKEAVVAITTSETVNYKKVSIEHLLASFANYKSKFHE